MKKRCVTILLCALGLSSILTPQVNAEAKGLDFPFSRGTYWIYKGQVQWVNVGSNKINTKNMTWRMEVKDVFKRGAIVAVRLKGYPQDLTWFENGRKPENYLMVQMSDQNLYLVRGQRIDEVLKRIKDPDDTFENLVSNDDLILSGPLWEGKLFGLSGPRRNDTLYQWSVERQDIIDSKERLAKIIKGIGKQRFHLAYRTLPDHQFVDFVPGIGITRYVYGHHGTISNVDVELIAFHPSN